MPAIKEGFVLYCHDAKVAESRMQGKEAKLLILDWPKMFKKGFTHAHIEWLKMHEIHWTLKNGVHKTYMRLARKSGFEVMR